MILVLGYFQVLWPLNRKPVPLPADQRLWPSVDVFIPTYNEPLSVVRTTVLAASVIDWPAGKITIHLLDDGRRDEFRAFCAEVGINYVTRTNNATRRDRSRSGAGCARPAAQVASARRTGAARRAAGRSARADAVGALVPAPVAGRCAQLRAKPAQAPAFALTCCPLFPAAGAHALAACCAARRHA